MAQLNNAEPQAQAAPPADIAARTPDQRVTGTPAQVETTVQVGTPQPPHLIAAELSRRGAHLVRHRNKSLQQHLFGTFNVLTAWQQPLRVRYAGLMHSVYSTDIFAHPTFSINERDQVRGLVGEAAERLAYLFCVIDRCELMSVVRSCSTDAIDTFELKNRLGGHAVLLTRSDAGDLLTIYMANAAEQSCRADGSPAGWLSQVSVMGRQARPLAEVTPPVFDGCTTVIPKTEEDELISRYERMIAGFGDGANDGATALNGQDDSPTAEWPQVAEPLVWGGFNAIACRRFHHAGALGHAAAKRFQQWGTPWDKRLSLLQWMHLCAALSNTTKTDELAFVARGFASAAQSVPPSPEHLYVELVRSGLLPVERLGNNNAPAPRSRVRGDGRPELPARFQTYIAGLRTNHKKPRMTMYPGLRAMPWHDPEQFSLVRDLEAAADKIAAEVLAMASHEFQDEAENIKRTGRWSVLFLYERGRKNERVCSQCPETVAAIETNRTVQSLGGLAYFSRLEPGTRVAPHTGPTNMRLRCHLGIDVPDGCGLRVGGTTRTWQEGRCIVFDDSFTHEVWNSSGKDRVVLIVDLWHPDLTDDEVALLEGLHRYATATGTGLVRYWNRNRAKAGGTA